MKVRRSVTVEDIADFADLARVALASGFTVSRAIATVGAHDDGPLSNAFSNAVSQPHRDESVADAIARIPDQCGERCRSLCAALVSSARYGSPVLPALERVSFELRLARRDEQATKARQASVYLLFPLICCVLPAFVLLAIVPLALGALSALPGAVP